MDASEALVRVRAAREELADAYDKIAVVYLAAAIGLRAPDWKPTAAPTRRLHSTTGALEDRLDEAVDALTAAGATASRGR